MARPDFRSAKLEARYSVPGKFRGSLFGMVRWTFASDGEPSHSLCADNCGILLLRDFPSDFCSFEANRKAENADSEIDEERFLASLGMTIMSDLLTAIAV